MSVNFYFSFRTEKIEIEIKIVKRNIYGELSL